MKIYKWIKRKRISVMFMAIFLIINAIFTNFTVIVNAEQNTNILASEIDMGEYTDTMAVGEKQLLTVTVLPVDATNQTLSYTSSNTAVATINGMGRITAIAIGQTTITAFCQEKIGSFILTVKAADIKSDIAVTELDMGEYESQIEIGSSQLLSVTPLPTDATNTKITYESSDTSVATINSMGRISAKKIGKTIITIKCDAITSKISISVVKKKDETIEVTALEIANHENKVKVDETVSLSTTVLPSDATNATVTYKSSNEKIATVNSSGEVKGISAGAVTITIKAETITKKENIKVVVPTKTITMNNKYLVLKPGDTFILSGTASPSDAPQKLSYTSINSRIATVSSGGNVTAMSEGDTSIIVSNGDYQAAVSVIVNSSNRASNSSDIDVSYENKSKTAVTYDNVVNANEVTKLDADMLKYLYDNKKSLLVVGDGYTISLDGNNIVNYRNEFMTDIQLASIEKSSEEGICFVINDGKPLCGDVTLCLDNVNGKYIYLYNEAKILKIIVFHSGKLLN